MLDLFHTLQDLQAWGVSLVAQTGLQFDLRSAQGKLIASLMAALAEFERDLLRERVRSGIAAARKRGVVFGRRPGSAHQGGPFRPQSAKARRRRPVVPGNQPPARVEQEHGPGYRQARPRLALACFKFRFVALLLQVGRTGPRAGCAELWHHQQRRRIAHSERHRPPLRPHRGSQYGPDRTGARTDRSGKAADHRFPPDGLRIFREGRYRAVSFLGARCARRRAHSGSAFCFPA